MTRFATLTALAALVSGPAFAGSLDATPVEPAIAPVAVAPVATSPDWTGFYGGGQIGYGNIDTDNPALDGQDFLGGFTGGYDYDFGTFVLGAGVDYDFADIALGGGTDLESIWRLKARAGYKIGEGLLYGTGGYAQADTNNLGDQDGYFVGGGYEHMVSDNVSFGGEVLYHEFDDFGATTTDVDAVTSQMRLTFRF